MSPVIILLFIAGYFALLVGVSLLTSKKSDNQTFFTANRNSPWYVVAFGMIGASLSGVTFISIPGWVESTQFSYMQMVFGYLLGYIVIATILMPLYYRLNLTSIYSYFEQRFGYYSYKTGAAFFLLSRIIGASFRLFLVAIVLQFTVMNSLGVPFFVTVIMTILLIWVYTFKSGIQTIVWTDTLQTAFMLLAVLLSIWYIADDLDLGVVKLHQTLQSSEYTRIFFFDDWGTNNFFKKFFSGAFIAIVMTGMDQDMMQKNLTCKNIKEAQKNMLWMAVLLIFINFIFLTLGALLYLYVKTYYIPMPERTDLLFPMLATFDFPMVAAAVFIVGLIAAAYSSADSALTSLTTSFCVDFLDFEKKAANGQPPDIQTRYWVHVGFSIVLVVTILTFKLFKGAVVDSIFIFATYTYGPLLGLFSFGIMTKLRVKDKLVPYICVASPLICAGLSIYSKELLNGYTFGYELLMLNGLLTFAGLLVLSEGKILNGSDTKSS